MVPARVSLPCKSTENAELELRSLWEQIDGALGIPMAFLGSFNCYKKCLIVCYDPKDNRVVSVCAQCAHTCVVLSIVIREGKATLSCSC